MADTSILVGDPGTVPSTDITGDDEWSVKWGERVDGVSQSTATIQDRTNDPTLEYGRVRQTYGVKVGSDFVFRGEIVGSGLELPAGFPWRRWGISATDWNTILDLRLIGVPTGSSWHIPPGYAPPAPGDIPTAPQPVTFDVDAYTSSTDVATLQHWLNAYAGAMGVDTVTFVNNYISSGLVDPVSGEGTIQPFHAALRSPIDQMRAMAPFPVFIWIDCNLALHWVHLPDDGYTAPAEITDTGANGTTKVGGRNMKFVYDATYMPEFAYVVGSNDFTYNYGLPIINGTGWGHSTAPGTDKRQVLVDAQALDETTRDAIADAYTAYGSRARLRISVDVCGRPDQQVDGWHCGQLVKITDARLPTSLNEQLWPIMALEGQTVPGHRELRVYRLTLGDAPVGRFYAKSGYTPTAVNLTKPRTPAKVHQVTPEHYDIAGGEPAQTLVSQLQDTTGSPMAQPGVVVSWTMKITDITGLVVTTSDASLSSASETTNNDGQTFVQFTSDSTRSDLYYDWFAVTA